MLDRNYIVSALRSGFTETQISSSLGVSPSAVHQFIQSHNLQDVAAENSRYTETDQTLDKIENVVATKLLKGLQTSFLDPMKLSRILKDVNGARRRSLNEGNTINHSQTTLVQLHLPERLKMKVVKNSQNEVIEVEGRALTTLPSGKLNQAIEHKRQAFAKTNTVGYTNSPNSQGEEQTNELTKTEIIDEL